MPESRRSFIKQTAAAAAVVGLGPMARPNHRASGTAAGTRAGAALNILILGGTGFTGPQQVEYALARGHTVTLLNRNRRRPDYFGNRVELIVGDLNADVSALRGRRFDVVIDNPTTSPAWVRNAAQYLRGNVGHYVFISTISVYPDFTGPGKLESSPTTPGPAGVDLYAVAPADWGRYYGALKSASEREVETHYPGANTIIRPGLIVGPLDPTDRFTYWPVRIDRGGDVLAPNAGAEPVQVIDARDLAEWTIRMAESRTRGTYNAVGPAGRLTMAEMLHGIKAVTTSNAQFVWVPYEFLEQHQVQEWAQLPVWLSPTGENRFQSTVSIERAVAAGLTFRPLAVTARDTLDWHATRPEAQKQSVAEGRRFGLSPTREAEVLGAWRTHRGEHSGPRTM